MLIRFCINNIAAWAFVTLVSFLPIASVVKSFTKNFSKQKKDECRGEAKARHINATLWKQQGHRIRARWTFLIKDVIVQLKCPHLWMLLLALWIMAGFHELRGSSLNMANIGFFLPCCGQTALQQHQMPQRIRRQGQMFRGSVQSLRPFVSSHHVSGVQAQGEGWKLLTRNRSKQTTEQGEQAARAFKETVQVKTVKRKGNKLAEMFLDLHTWFISYLFHIISYHIHIYSDPSFSIVFSVSFTCICGVLCTIATIISIHEPEPGSIRPQKSQWPKLEQIGTSDWWIAIIIAS